MIDLSEMYTVRMRYPFKVENYVRYHGRVNFGQGGQAHDVMDVIKEFGMVPYEAYTGKTWDKDRHNHSELGSVLKGMIDAVIKRRNPTPVWKKAVDKVLDVYMGEVPAEFTYEGKTYTPKSFAKETGLNPDDYVEITSYTHHPFYEKFILEIPDNYDNSFYYNVPVDELMNIIDNALENGYSVAFDGDVSDKFFFGKKGYAVVPEDRLDTEAEEPEKEVQVTQKMRQEQFDNFKITDDHLMHLTGIAKNQEGTKFYYTKNSWGAESKGKERQFKGYWYMSEQYVRLSTIAIMVHKDAIPAAIRTKLNIK
ncbi:MAG: C1 family peptidase [Rhodothermaceae bacterium]